MKLTFYFFFLTIYLSAQVKGVVKDSVSGKPIPYVTISLENQAKGTTSDEDGKFSINTQTGNLVFSAVGYHKKKVSITKEMNVFMQPKNYTLQDVVILNKLQTKTIEIGDYKNSIRQAFDNGPKIDAKFFPYLTKYKKTRFIKKFTVYTDSQIDSAIVKMRLYSVDENGLPASDLLQKDIIVKPKKGIYRNVIDVSDYNLIFPKKGLFVAFEKLFIDKNKVEKTIIDQNTNTVKTQKIYYPFMLYNRIELSGIFTYYGGAWQKIEEKNNENKMVVKPYFEPAITVFLSN